MTPGKLDDLDKILYDNLSKQQRAWIIKELYANAIFGQNISEGLATVAATITKLLDSSSTKYGRLDTIIFKRCLLLLPADTESGQILRDAAYKQIARKL